MSDNPNRKHNGKSRVLVVDKNHKVSEKVGFFGNFHEAYWWAVQNKYELRQYTALS